MSSVPGQSIRTGNHQAFHCSIQACFIQFQVYFLIDIATLNSYFDETKHCGTSEYLGEAKASSFYNNDILEEDLPQVIQLRHLSNSKFCVAFAKSLTFSPLLLRAKAGDRKAKLTRWYGLAINEVILLPDMSPIRIFTHFTAFRFESSP